MFDELTPAQKAFTQQFAELGVVLKRWVRKIRDEKTALHISITPELNGSTTYAGSSIGNLNIKFQIKGVRHDLRDALEPMLSQAGIEFQRHGWDDHDDKGKYSYYDLNLETLLPEAVAALRKTIEAAIGASPIDEIAKQMDAYVAGMPPDEQFRAVMDILVASQAIKPSREKGKVLEAIANIGYKEKDKKEEQRTRERDEEETEYRKKHGMPPKGGYRIKVEEGKEQGPNFLS